MEPVHGKDIAPRVSGMISPKHQVHGFTVDLTVKEISSVDPTGRVDFGGSEYTAAGKLPIAAMRRNLEDKYLWWDLGRGSYFVEFNETVELAADEFGYLEPDDRLIRAGATHAPFYLRGRVAPIETLLTVDAVRLQVKQNARIARIRVFRAATAASLAAAPAAASAKSAAKPARKKK
jgi:deoxycytidine triphosphate deaminase